MRTHAARLALLVPLALPTTALAQALGPREVRAVAPVPLPSTATLTLVRGPVEIVAGTGNPSESRPAAAGDTLSRGARVRVGDGGWAELTLPNGTALQLAEHADVMLFASPTPPAPGRRPSTATTLLRGTVHVRAGDAAAPFGRAWMPLDTALVTVLVGRGDGVVYADRAGHLTRVSVHRGHLRVRAGSREYAVPEGHGVSERLGHPSAPLHALPPQPAWRTAPQAAASGGGPVGASATFGFPSPPPARAFAWRVRVARDEGFRDVIADVRLRGAERRWEGAGLTPGSYFVQVAALDADRLESVPSASARVEVEGPRVAPGELGTDGRPGRVATVRVPGGILCGLDGARLLPVDEPVRLAPGRSHRLRCASQPDGRDAHTTVIPADAAGPLVHELRSRGVTLGESALSLRLRDAEGLPVPYAEVAVTADRGVTVEPLREATERGAYVATVRWPRGVHRARFRFVVNGEAAFEEELEDAR